MADVIISPGAETDWRIDLHTFETRLRERWPEAATRRVELPSGTDLDFDIGYLAGHVLADRQAISLGGDLSNAPEFAAWLRSVVPAEQELLIYDESFSFHQPLEPGITAEEIVVG